MPPIWPMEPVSAATRKIARSFRSLLKNWLGPMPTVNSVVPPLRAMARASSSTAAAGAHVTFSTSAGVMLASRYSRVRSKTGRACTVVPFARVTVNVPASAGSIPAFVKWSPTMSRLTATGFCARASHITKSAKSPRSASGIWMPFWSTVRTAAVPFGRTLTQLVSSDSL